MAQAHATKLTFEEEHVDIAQAGEKLSQAFSNLEARIEAVLKTRSTQNIPNELNEKLQAIETDHQQLDKAHNALQEENTKLQGKLLDANKRYESIQSENQELLTTLNATIQKVEQLLGV